jgi:hypothetical protein
MTYLIKDHDINFSCPSADFTDKNCEILNNQFPHHTFLYKEYCQQTKWLNKGKKKSKQPQKCSTSSSKLSSLACSVFSEKVFNFEYSVAF